MQKQDIRYDICFGKTIVEKQLPGKPRFQPGAGNWHRSEPEPVERERETEPVEPEPAGYY